MKISLKKREKISEQILALLFSTSPKPLFTSHIADDLARDEEFIKTLLLELKDKNLILEIDKTPKGVKYLRRARWRLSDAAYSIYKQNQHLK